MNLRKAGGRASPKRDKFLLPDIVDGTPVLITRAKYPRTHRMKKKSESGVERATPMQKRALENHLFKGMNKTEAMEKAGYSMTPHNTAGINAALEKRPIVKALEKRKITNDTVAEVIEGGLKAMRPDDHKFPDHTARAPYVREVNRILGNYAPTKVQVREQAVVINLTSDDAAKFQKYRAMRAGNGGNEDGAD